MNLYLSDLCDSSCIVAGGCGYQDFIHGQQTKGLIGPFTRKAECANP